MDLANVAPIRTDQIVAVLGAGTMGRGIAMVAATAGHKVFLHDVLPAAISSSLNQIKIDLDRMVSKGRLSSEERELRIERILPAEKLETLAAADLVIEAVIEEIEGKVALLKQVESMTKPQTIIATNTSSLSVTAIAARLDRPQQVAGMHFFNPATLMPLVEVVSGHATSSGITGMIYATALAWGKTPVLCKSTPGFIVNRVARPYYGEALRLLNEGAADPATLDLVLREGGGFRMGPFELMDLIGHDVNYAVTRAVYEAFYYDSRYMPSLLQKDLVDAGWLGRKTGRGFFQYGEASANEPIAETPPSPKPTTIVVEGDLGPASGLIERARTAGVKIETAPGQGVIRIDDIVLALTDGRTATERTAEVGGPVILFDLMLDYQTGQTIALAPGDQLNESHLEKAVGFFQAIDISVLVVDDVPGLVVMRTVAMLANEAAEALNQGIATASDIDLAMMKGVNYPRGPLQWADDIGPVRVFRVIQNLSSTYGEDRYRPSPLLRRFSVSGRSFMGNTRSQS